MTRARESRSSGSLLSVGSTGSILSIGSAFSVGGILSWRARPGRRF